MKLPQYALESLAVASGLTLITSTTFIRLPIIASLSTASTIGIGYLLFKKEKEDAHLSEVKSLTARLTASDTQVSELQGLLASYQKQVKELSPLQDSLDSLNVNYNALKLYADQQREKVSALKESTARHEKEMSSVQVELEKALLERDSMTAQLSAQKSEWVSKFDKLIAEYELDIAKLTHSNHELERELNRFKDSKDLIVKTEVMSVQMRATEMQEQLSKLSDTNKALSSHLNQSVDIVTELKGEFDYLTGEGYSQLQTAHEQQLLVCQNDLAKLQARLLEVEKPLLFEQIGDYARADKLIAQLHLLTGAVLDASEITPVDEGAFEVALNVRDRKARGQAFVKSLSDLGEVLQVECACLVPLTFRFDAQNPHRILTKLRYRKAVATSSVKSLPWKTVEQFVGLAGKWSRVRITGGSESGKSPLAELIVGAMQQVKGSMDVNLAFPVADSVKNNWVLKVTHQDVLKAAREAVALLKTPPKQFHLTVLDECDTALDRQRDLASVVKELIKTGSHSNVGVILIGQNANVRQWKGFDRSDFENIVNVHIGTNAYHALENSNLSQAEKDKLKGQADTLTKHCEIANKGVEEPDKLSRFALVVDPSKTPYFMQLPTFGSIPFDNSKVSLDNSKAVIQCPHCGSSSHKLNGKYADGVARRKCKECGKTYRSDLETSKV